MALHRLADANPAVSNKDDVSGTSSAPSVNAGAVTNLAGGGLRLTKNAFTPLAQFVDITQPWTFMAGLTVNVASAPSSLVGVLSSVDYAARGCSLYSAPGATVNASTAVSPNWRQSIDGAQSAVGIAAVTSSGWTFGRGTTVLMRHQGAGAGTVDVYCGASAALIVSQAITIDTTGEQGTPGSKTTPMKFAAGHPLFTGGDLNVESLAVWARALPSADAIAAHNANAALASARARAWS